tara:strand:+ start:36 stop:164 length:129 start_codon:yes stop_codon:yes gene_type:complete
MKTTLEILYEIRDTLNSIQHGIQDISVAVSEEDTQREDSVRN